MNGFQTVELKETEYGYPKEWQSLSDRPQTLFAVGDISLIQTRKFTVVGSRRTPVAALKTGAEIVKGIANAFTLVTGAADGGDAVAIESALEMGGKVICVLAGGFAHLPQNNLPLLKRVAEQGLLLSPHPHDTPVRNFSYEYRNKLLAALGEGTLVLGAGEKSGALITAKYAKTFGKKLFALPYAPNSFVGVGCNALIKNGANLTENANDVLNAFGLQEQKKKAAPPLSDAEMKILMALKELSEAHILEVAEKSGVPVFKVRALLSALEVKGLAVPLGGNCFSAT